MAVGCVAATRFMRPQGVTSCQPHKKPLQGQCKVTAFGLVNQAMVAQPTAATAPFVV